MLTINKVLQALSDGKAVTDDPETYIRLEDDLFVERDRKTDKAIAFFGEFEFNVNEVRSDLTDYEIYEKSVLDDVEKKYLMAVIKPYRSRVMSIRKATVGTLYQKIIIRVRHLPELDDNNCIVLPFFYKGKMYKGMKDDKEYSLKELGL